MINMHTQHDPFINPQQEPTFKDMALREIPISQTNISMMAYAIQRSISDGKVEPIEAAVRLNAMKKLCEEALGLIRKDVIDSIEAGNTAKDGCEVEKMEAGTKYDYSEDAEMMSYDIAQKQLDAAKKKRSEFLRKIPAGKELVDTDTGEVIATGPSKTSTTTFKVTLAK